MSNPNEEGPASLDVFSSTIWPAAHKDGAADLLFTSTANMRSLLAALVSKQLAAASQIAL